MDGAPSRRSWGIGLGTDTRISCDNIGGCCDATENDCVGAVIARSGSGVLCLLIGPTVSRLTSAVRLAGRSFSVSDGGPSDRFDAPVEF